MIVVLSIATACTTATGSNDRDSNPMQGTWSITGINYIYSDTTYRVTCTYPGRLIVDESKYSIMYNPYGTERESADTLSKMTDDEIKYAFKTIVFNSGSYEIIGQDFVTTADIAKVPGFEGGIQHYRIGTDNSKFSLTMYDETYPSGEKPEWFGNLEIQFLLNRN